MGIVRKENGEVVLRDDEPGVGEIGKELDVAIERELAVRRAARSERPPADVVHPCNRDLYVDVTAVGFETCALSSPAVDLIDRYVNAVVVQGESPRWQSGEVGSEQKVGGPCESGVESRIPAQLLKRVDDQGAILPSPCESDGLV